MVDIEYMWYGDMKIERIWENNKITKIKRYYKHPNGKLELVFWEERQFHDNGKVKCIFNSNDEIYEFDKEGNPIQ